MRIFNAGVGKFFKMIYSSMSADKAVNNKPANNKPANNKPGNNKPGNNRPANNGSDMNYPPLRIGSNLFNNTAKNNKSTPELLDNKTINLISRYDVTMLDVNKSSTRHGAGTYGYVTSAEITFKFKGYRRKKLISAMKVSTDPKVLTHGIPDDIIRECATYARILKSDNIAKGLFAKIHKDSQSMILEHYSVNIQDLFEKMAIPWDVRDDLIRAIFYQIVHGLKELHELGFIHKDLKPANILLSYDGRVLIADFGLTSYLVNGSDKPQDFYMKETTPYIEPPEGNNALKNHLIGKSYDIWSLGSVLTYMICRSNIFDMWSEFGPLWRDETKPLLMSKYKEHKKTIIDYFDDNLQKRAPKPSNDFLGFAKDLLDKMLNIENPEARPTAEDILKHDWFNGLTLERAMDTVKTALTLPSSNKKNNFGNAGKTKIVAATRKTSFANAAIHMPSYFQIVPHKLVTRFLNDELHAEIATEIKLLFKGFSEYFYEYLHGLELFNRVVLKNPELNSKLYLFTCFNITFKITANDSIGPNEFKYIVSNGYARDGAEITRAEINIIKLLNGDTHPQVGGFLDKITSKISSTEGTNYKKLSAALKILNKIFTGSDEIDNYIDIKDEDTTFNMTIEKSEQVTHLVRHLPKI
jgi:serine/threonine protein kinase